MLRVLESYLRVSCFDTAETIFSTREFSPHLRAFECIFDCVVR